jgi:hypothetical protein
MIQTSNFKVEWQKCKNSGQGTIVRGVKPEPVLGYWLKLITSSEVPSYWKLSIGSGNSVAG